MINLGKSLFVSESESDKYLLDFLKEETMIGVYIFYWSYAPPPTMEANLCWE